MTNDKRLNKSMTTRPLDEQRAEFIKSRFLAMPLAGTIAWIVVGIAGATLSEFNAAIALFIATGMIVYLGLFISKFTGENFTDRSKPKNEFDQLFFYCAGMAILVYSIAIPFFLQNVSSLPLTVGILTGLMWLPITWMIKHWIGIFHTLVRTALILIAWYVFPQHRFVAIPIVIVAVYIVTIFILERRWRAANAIA
jgi:hypothetical protein